MNNQNKIKKTEKENEKEFKKSSYPIQEKYES